MFFGLKLFETPKIGKILQKNGLSPIIIEQALDRQKKSGSRIGEELIAMGVVNGKQLYSAIAEQHKVEFADLLQEPCDEDLLNEGLRDKYLQYSAIPWKDDDGNIKIAVADFSQETFEWVKENFPGGKIVATSPFDIKHTISTIFSQRNNEDAINSLWSKYPAKSAREIFAKNLGKTALKVIFAFTLLSFFALLFLPPVFIAVNLFYFITLLFKAVLFSVGFRSDKGNKDIVLAANIEEKALPVYTILVPLYEEKQKTILQLVSAIKNLDYPKSKLDVKLIVEADDKETISYVRRLRCERIFDIVEVPPSYPRTKPKALNYALRFARGKYVTIYDAEDKPEAIQLREAVYKFMNGGKDLGCLQGRLNYYNKDENILARMFAFEYGGWFGFLLPGLHRLKIPIPLGGTSNHFPIRVLRELLAWDPYNVTEDADIGVRLAASGYKTDLLDSHTYEEAPLSIVSWLKQRSRWIKGHIQTYIVHTRPDSALYNNVGFIGAMGFLFFLGAPCFVFISMPLVIFASFIMFMEVAALPDWFLSFAIFNLLTGAVLHILFAVAVVNKFRWKNMMSYCIAFPLYWILHSIASFRAFWQLFVRPHYWEKTEHGLTTVNLPVVSHQSIA